MSHIADLVVLNLESSFENIIAVDVEKYFVMPAAQILSPGKLHPNQPESALVVCSPFLQ